MRERDPGVDDGTGRDEERNEERETRSGKRETRNEKRHSGGDKYLICYPRMCGRGRGVSMGGQEMRDAVEECRARMGCEGQRDEG